MRPALSGLFWGALLLLLAASPFILVTLFAQPAVPEQAHPISLSDLAQGLKSGTITSIQITDNRGLATDELGDEFAFQIDDRTDPIHELAAFGVGPEQLSRVEFVVRESPSYGDWWQGLVNLLPALLLGIWFLLVMRATPGTNNNELLTLTRHPARRFGGSADAVQFGDVAGVEEAKQELQEIVEFLVKPEKFVSVGARIPRGVLLVGPPGTGKTLLARAVAGEANVPFFSISGSEFVEIVVGVGASRVRDLFREAERSAPCIVFVDEIDAIGRQRGAGVGSPNDEREQTLNQILCEMDGFDSSSNVIVLAATNRADVLDPALLRPGRFDRQVVVPTPDVYGRRAILEVHARGRPLDTTVDLLALARVTPGFSGADLANVINEGAILAARRAKRTIGMIELEDAIDRVLAGPETRSRVTAADERARVAYHESGHAVMMHYLKDHPPLQRVTIVRHGLSGGYTRALGDDNLVVSRNELKATLAAALGGHAAEQVLLGEVASGAEDDLTTATDIACRMIKRYGMSERLGPVCLGEVSPRDPSWRFSSVTKNYSERTAETIDSEIQSLLHEGYQQAVAILTEHRVVVDRLAAALLQYETLEGEALARVFFTD